MIPPGGDCNSEIIGLENNELLGDLNGDSIINVQDIIIAINLILYSNYNTNADMNLDGTVDVLDIIQIINIILNNELHLYRKNNQYEFNHNYETKIEIIRNWIVSFEK